jgi:uncharacterized RDD family membrane protein YckC
MIKAGLLKRIGAFIIDLFVFIVISFLFNGLVTKNIANALPIVSNAQQTYYESAIATGLFEGDSFDTLDYISSDYDNKLTAFYESYNDLDAYNKLKAENYKAYFTYDETTSTYVETGDTSTMNSVYYSIIRYHASSYWMNQDENSHQAAITISVTIIVEYFISMFIGGIINYIIIPLILKNGQTLGKKLLQIYVVNLRGDYHVKWVQSLVRGISIVVIEIELGIVSFGVIPLVSLLVSAFNSKGQSLHDLICSTTVVDMTLGPDMTNESKQITLTSFASLDQEIASGEVSSNQQIDSNKEGGKHE